MAKSLEKQKTNIRPDNPFLKVKGEYTFDIDTTKSGQEKTDFIHNKITDYLFNKTGQLYIFQSGDNSRVHTLDTTSGTARSVNRKVSELLKDAPQDIQKLLTQYPQTQKSKVTIKITTDPLDIVKKSTQQSWESFETVGSESCKGIFSDIENNNAIAYVYIGDKKEPDGRFMLRWCNTPEKKADIGIEPIMYPRKSYAMEIYDSLRNIIVSKGYGSYQDCTTPYKYEGYSDYIGGSGEITYHSGDSSSSSKGILIQYASLPNISRNFALALAEHTIDRAVRRALAENKAVCEIDDVVDKLSKDIDDDTKVNLITTCARPLNKLTEIAFNNLIKDESRVRSILALTIKDKKYLNILANDNGRDVIWGLSINDAICDMENIVNKLSKDTEDSVKIKLIENCTKSHNKLTETAINHLRNDKSEDVRNALTKAINKNYNEDDRIKNSRSKTRNVKSFS